MPDDPEHWPIPLNPAPSHFARWEILQRMQQEIAQYLRMQKIIDDMRRRYCGTDQEKK